eukprot:383307-Rhodomonas_salina.1
MCGHGGCAMAMLSMSGVPAKAETSTSNRKAARESSFQHQSRGDTASTSFLSDLTCDGQYQAGFVATRSVVFEQRKRHEHSVMICLTTHHQRVVRVVHLLDEHQYVPTNSHGHRYAAATRCDRTMLPDQSYSKLPPCTADLDRFLYA